MRIYAAGKIEENQFSDANILFALKKDLDVGGKLLFERYYKPLLFFSDTYFKGNNFSEDIVQEVFYRFIKDKMYKKVTAVTLSSYLFQCVKNACLNKVRDQRKFTTAENLKLDVIEEEIYSISPELLKSIYAAINALPEKTRLVVTFVIVQNKKYKEAATELGVSVNTVKRLLSNGLKQLRKQFSDMLVMFLFFGKCIYTKNNH